MRVQNVMIRTHEWQRQEIWFDVSELIYLAHSRKVLCPVCACSLHSPRFPKFKHRAAESKKPDSRVAYWLTVAISPEILLLRVIIIWRSRTSEKFRCNVTHDDVNFMSKIAWYLIRFAMTMIYRCYSVRAHCSILAWLLNRHFILNNDLIGT